MIPAKSFSNTHSNLAVLERNLLTEKDELKNLLQKLFTSQLLAVLGTQGQSGPYGNLVAFAATDDLKSILFATTRSTRKYDNLMQTPRVAMVMDNRSNDEEDFHEAVAVTATGSVKEIEGAEKDALRSLFLSRHPYLIDFVSAPTCALLKVDVETYYIVRQFQKVMELHIRS
jgi:nitroimidazol reductase NimA-like FMN-containing flavoprotein (pyridoxamine 5'-phosphate oxidase superfamily)